MYQSRRFEKRAAVSPMATAAIAALAAGSIPWLQKDEDDNNETRGKKIAKSLLYALAGGAGGYGIHRLLSGGTTNTKANPELADRTLYDKLYKANDTQKSLESELDPLKNLVDPEKYRDMTAEKRQSIANYRAYGDAMKEQLRKVKDMSDALDNVPKEYITPKMRERQRRMLNGALNYQDMMKGR